MDGRRPRADHRSPLPPRRGTRPLTSAETTAGADGADLGEDHDELEVLPPGGGAPAAELGLLLFVVVAGHLSLFPKVADLDGFYHIGHAAAYLDGSFLDTSLPWATQSIIRDYGADLWWGFHVALAPFAALGDPATGIRLAAALLTAILGLAVWGALRRLMVPRAGLWAAAFLVAVPNVFFRYLMVRPHVLSLGASIVLLATLVRGRWWHVLLLAAAIAWLHLSLFWVAPGLVAAYALARVGVVAAGGADPEDHVVPISHAATAVVVGTALGWLLRPNPMATARLLEVQLVRLFAQKATEEPLLFAAELMPIGVSELLRTSWLFTAAWLVDVAWTARAVMTGALLRLGRQRATFLASATLVSLAFLGLAVLSARRAMVQWVAFGFMTLPLAWALVRPSLAAGRPGLRRVVAGIAGVLLTLHLAWGAWRHALNIEHVAFAGDSLAEAAAFLARESDPGDIVFHARWDNFGPLLAHDRVNRYLGGMDPIFQFAHDPRAYWEHFWLSTDIDTELTCDAYPCAGATMTDSWVAIREHFGARWVLVEPRRNPRLTLHLLNDPRFELALETQREAVFEVLGPSAGGR